MIKKNVRTVFFNNYIAIQVVNKQFGLKNNNNLLPVVVCLFVIIAPKLLQYFIGKNMSPGTFSPVLFSVVRS